MRGMRSRFYGCGRHRPGYAFEIAIWHDHPKTWTWEMDRPVEWHEMEEASARLGLRVASDTTPPPPKPQDARSRYLHIDTQAQRPITACQGPVQLPYDM